MTDEPRSEQGSWGAFTHAAVGMAIVGLDGRFERVNGAFARLLGRPEDDLIGRSFLDATEPSDHEVGSDDLRRLVAGEIEAVQHDKRYLSGAGEQAWVRLSVAAVCDRSGAALHLLAQVEDITERRRSEQMLRSSLARFRGVFESSPVSMGLVDLDGVIRSANLAFSDLVGGDQADLAGRPLNELISGLTTADVRRAAGGETTTIGERQFVRADSSSGWVFVVATRLEPVGDSAAELIVQLVDFSERKVAEESLRHNVLHDELTGLPNRLQFRQRLLLGLGDRRRAGSNLGVLMVDLNHFKQVNDGLGHPSGDLVLVEAGRRILAMSRSTDTAARYGGDEFALVALDIRDDAEAIAMAANLRRRLCEPYQVANNVIHVGASVGFALAPADGQDADVLVQKADIALYRAKRLSGGIAGFSGDDDDASLQRLGLVEDLRRAVASDGIEVAYQPIVSADRTVRSVEALARWQHPERGTIPPDQFIPLAERDHLLDAITSLVLGRATTQLASWTEKGLDIPNLSVNVSAASLANDVLLNMVEDALRASRLAGERLILEFTESGLTDASDPQVVAAIGRLRGLGVQLSIDDFGTGYSSMAYLKRLSFDELKIDQSFVVDLDSDARSVPIVRSVIQLAHSLDLRAVAEGVETADAERVLRELGCDLLQGYGICRPGQASTVEDYVAKATAKETPDAVNAVTVPARNPVSRKLTILAVDDDEVRRRALTVRFEDLGHKTHEAASGSAAIRLRDRFIPDVVVLNQLLPGLSGVETAARLRRSGHLGPIFMLSRLLPAATRTVTFPLDIWPVSKSDTEILLQVIEYYAAQAPAPGKLVGGSTLAVLPHQDGRN